MKTLIPILAVGLALLTPMSAAEPPKPAKPSVTLTVKRHLIDSEHDQQGPRKSREKTITLRVDIQNVSSSTVEESILSGDVLVMRSVGEREKVVKEKLGTMKVPALKPNEKITLDFGKFKLNDFQWKHRKFEESLEEWSVVCKKGETEIGKNLSNVRYTTLEKEAMSDEPGPNRPNRPDGLRPGRLRPFGR